MSVDKVVKVFIAGLAIVGHLNSFFDEVVSESDLELVFEAVAPVTALSQVHHGAPEAALEELFAHLQALEFVHGFDLLFTFSTSLFQHFVLVLDPLDFTLNFVLPLLVEGDLSFVVFALVLADLLKFSLLFNLKQSLFDRFGQKDVKDGSNLTIVVE